MTGIQPTLAQDVPDQPRLAIPDDVAACLSTSLRSELASLPPEQQQAFVEAFQSKSANLAMATCCRSAIATTDCSAAGR